MNETSLYYVFLFIAGSMIGSFLNVVIFRTPQLLLATPELTELASDEDYHIPEQWQKRFVWGLDYIFSDLVYSLLYIKDDFFKEFKTVFKGLSFPASHCGNCQSTIAWYDNLPVLSWFILGGKCRKCHQAYSFRYPLIEILTGILFVYTFYLKGLTIDLIFFLIFVSTVWSMFWIDLDTQFIFNVMTYPSIFLGILYNGTNGNLKWSFIGALIAWCLFEFVMLFSIWFLQKEGMGGGDVKLAILIGVWLGPVLLMSTLMMAFIAGSIVGVFLMAIRRESRPFPFGPFLIAGSLVSMSVGNNLWTWYIDKSMW